MSSDSEEFETKNNSNDLEKEADAPPEIGKRNSSPESQDVTQPKKKKKVESLPEKKTKQLVKKKTHTLPEKVSSDTEQLPPEKEETVGEDLSSKSVEDDSGEKTSINTTGEKQKNPLTEEKSEEVTESDKSFQADGILYDEKADFSKGQVKDLPSKDPAGKRSSSPESQDVTKPKKKKKASQTAGKSPNKGFTSLSEKKTIKIVKKKKHKLSEKGSFDTEKPLPEEEETVVEGEKSVSKSVEDDSRENISINTSGEKQKNPLTEEKSEKLTESDSSFQADGITCDGKADFSKGHVKDLPFILPEKVSSNKEQQPPEKEETVEENLSSKSVGDDSGEKISINTTGGEQKTPLTEEKSENVTECDSSFQADGITYDGKADFSKGQVKDLPSKDPAGKRSSSPRSQDVTIQKKKKKASQTAGKSPNKGFTSLPEKKTIQIVKKNKHKLSEKGNVDIEKLLPEEEETVVEGKKSVSKSVEDDSRERIPISSIGEKQTNPLTDEKNVTEFDTSFKTKSISCSAGADPGKSQVIHLPPKDSAGKISSSEIQNVPRQKKKKIACKSPIKSVADLPKNETLLLVKKKKLKLSEKVSPKTMQPPPEKKKTVVEVKKPIRKSSKSVEDDSGEGNPINSVGERQTNPRNEEKETTESNTSFQTKSISYGAGVESAKSQVIDLPSKNSKQKINKLHENETFNLNKGFKQEKPSETTTGSKIKILSNHQIDSSNKSFADELNEISRDNDYKQESIKTKKNIKGCEESNFCVISPNSSQGQSEDQQIIEKFCIKPCRIILTRVTEKDLKKKSGKPTLEANLNPCIESDTKNKTQLNSVQIKEKALGKRNKCIELEELTQKKNETATDSLKTLKITDLAAQSPAVSPSEKVVFNQENVEHKETINENTIRTVEINDCQEANQNQPEELNISDKAQTQGDMSSDNNLSHKEKTEPEKIVCENTIQTGNINDGLEERGSVETHTEEMEILYRTGAGVSSEQILQDKEKIECEETIGKNTLNSVDINYRQVEKELIRNQPKELNIPDETQTKPVLSLEPTLSEKDNETVCESIIKTGDLHDCQNERKSVQSEEFTISEEAKTQAVVSSDKIFSDNEKSEHKVNISENTIQTGNINDRPEEIGLVENQAEEMDISDEEDNISQSSDENVKTPIQLPEKENNRSMSYKDPMVDDPVWRDRLPPPPGCESPPPPGCETPPPPSLPSQDQISSPPQCKASSTLCVADIMKSAKQSSSGLYEIEFEINHLPKFTVDYVIKKALRENEVKTFSGATVRSTGIYTPFGTKKSVNKVCDKPLNLYIKALTLQSLAMALACVLKVITEGEEDENIQVDQVFVSLPHAPAEFKLNDHLVGEGGSNLQYITEQTGAEVTLRGQGSGYLEHTTGLELPHPLHLRIRHSTAEGLKLALDTALNLLQTVGDELKEFCNQGGQKQMTQAVQPTMVPVPVLTAVPTIVPVPVPTAVPTIVPAPVPTAVPTIVPAPVPTSCTDPTPTPSAVSTMASNTSLALGLFTPSFLAPPSGPSVLAGSSSAPLAPFTPKVGSSFATTSSSVLSNYKTAAQLITQAGNTSSSTTKVVYESGPQLKSQSSSKTFVSSAANTSLQTASSFQFRVPPPPMPKPHPKRTLSNVTVPPPIRNTPPTTPHHRQPSASSSLTRPPYKKEEIQMKDYKSTTGAPGLSPTSIKAGNKPKKIHFSIVTAVKQGKVFWANPLLQKKTSSSEDQDRTGETEKSNPPRKASGAETEKNRKGSRWGQKPEDVIETSKVSQLLARVEEQVNKMPSGGDKARLETTLRLLKTGVPLSPCANEEELSQFKIVLEILKKTLEYLPSNQLSKTLWEIFRTLKKDFDIVTDERSSEQQDKKTSYKKTEPLAKEVIAENEADSRETSRRRDKKRSAKSPVREQKRKSSKSSSSTSYSRSSRYSQDSQDRKYSYKTSYYNRSDKLDKHTSIDSTQEQKRGETKKSSFDDKRWKPTMTLPCYEEYDKGLQTTSSNRKTDSEMREEKQKPVTMKAEVYLPKPSKSSTCDELNKIVELLHIALKNASDSLKHDTIKSEFYKIAQLLDHALPSGVEATDEQKSQFSIVLDVLEQALQRNSHALGPQSARLSSIIALLKSLLNTNSESANLCKIEGNQNPSMSPSNTLRPTQTSSDIRPVPEIKAKNELNDQQSDQLTVITQLLQKAIQNYANSVGQSNMREQLAGISKWLEEAVSNRVKSLEKKQSNLLYVLKCLEQLLTNNPSLSNQPKELLGIMQTFKHALQSKPSGSATDIQKNVSNPMNKTSNSLTSVQTQNTPSLSNRQLPSVSPNQHKSPHVPPNEHQSQLLEIIKLLKKALDSYYSSMEPGYLRSQLTQFSQLLDRVLQENSSTTPPDQLKKQMAPLVQLLQQLLKNQQTSNSESKQLLHILQLIEKNLNPPVVMNPVTPLNPSQPANIMGSLQQLQMLQLQQQMQSGSHTSMALPFQPVQMQTAPIANNVLQLQLMQQMQQMQAALGTLQQQPANHLNNKLTELSQQMQSLQQQFSQVSQLNQQQPYQTMSVPQQQPFLQSLSTTGPQSFLRPATGPQSFVQPGTRPQSFVQPGTRPQSFVQPGTRPQSFVQPSTQPQLSGLPGTLQEPNLSEFMRQLQQQFKRGE